MALPLEDIELIKRLKYRYCRCIDTANWPELKELFTEDASICYVGGTYRFEANGRAKILEALEDAFNSQSVARHNVHHPEIDVLTPTTAKATWYLDDWFLSLKHMIVTHGSALYRDEYVKRDGRWLIQCATYDRLFEIVTPIKDVPNITAHWLGRHGKELAA